MNCIACDKIFKSKAAMSRHSRERFLDKVMSDDQNPNQKPSQNSEKCSKSSNNVKIPKFSERQKQYQQSSES